MEGLTIFDILIILFLLFTFLSSIFKAKKRIPQQGGEDVKASQPGEQVRRIPPQRTTPTPAAPNPHGRTVILEDEDNDILDEIESFFKVGDEEPKSPSAERKPQQTQEKIFEPISRQSKPAEPIREKVTTFQFETFLERSKRIEAEIASKKKKLEKYKIDTSFFEKTKGQVVSLQKDTFASSFKSKLKHPSKLREFILFSELIGKRKVLRRF